MPSTTFPWTRRLDDRTTILGLDATRSHLSATGRLPLAQLDAARSLLADPATRPPRLIVASHYPVVAPPAYAAELAFKRMKNADEVRSWLSTLGPHLYCCGHVHAAWAYSPPDWPDHLSLNSGAPLLRDPTGLRPPASWRSPSTTPASPSSTTHGSATTGRRSRSTRTRPSSPPSRRPCHDPGSSGI